MVLPHSSIEFLFLKMTHVISLVGASSGLDGYIKLWDMETGKLLKSIDGGPGYYFNIHEIYALQIFYLMYTRFAMPLVLVSI